MKRDFVKTAMLLDLYGELLSQKQKICLELYYHEDYSLTEIAQLQGITPQGAKYNISQGFDVLIRREEQLGFLARLETISETLLTVQAQLEAIRAKHPAAADALSAVSQQLEQLSF